MYIHFITRREKKTSPPPKGLIISSPLVIYGLLPRETAKEGKRGERCWGGGAPQGLGGLVWFTVKGFLSDFIQNLCMYIHVFNVLYCTVQHVRA